MGARAEGKYRERRYTWLRARHCGGVLSTPRALPHARGAVRRAVPATAGMLLLCGRHCTCCVGYVGGGVKRGCVCGGVGSIFTIMVTFDQDIYDGVWEYVMAVIRGNTA